MKRAERRKMADIVEAFGEINKDIHSAFDIMSDLLGKIKDFDTWKKVENDNRKAKKRYYDFDALLSGDSNWYYINYYGEMNNNVVGFTFVVGVECDEEENYLEFVEYLDSNLNVNTPMLCIYGIYEPIDNKKKFIVDEDDWNYVDEILRFTHGWKNFDKTKLAYDEWLDINIGYLDENEKINKDYMDVGWYKTAQVKIIPITNIVSEEKAENIIADLIKEVND